MAEQDYGLISGDARVKEIDQLLNQLKSILEGGAYTPKKGDPNYVGPGRTVQLPMFSDARNNVLAQQATLISEKERIVAALAKRAAEYKPPSGPDLPSTKKEKEIVSKYINLAPAVSSVGGRAATPEEVRVAQQGGLRTSAATPTVTPTVTPTATPTATTTATPTATPTAATTGVTTTTPATGKGKGKGKRKVDTGWEEVFKQQFPQYSYLLDANVFGQDMADVLRRAVTEEWFKQPDQIETLMTQAVTGTNYYRTTTTNQQAFDKLTPANRQQLIDQQLISLKDTYGNLQFNEQQLTEIATKAARDGKQGKALELFVYQQALSTVPGATGFVAPTAASRVMTSSAADRIRNIGREYGVLPSEQEIQDVLTGVKSEDDLRQSYKLVARRWYKGVEEDIDSGLTIQQIFAPYRQYAAAILEKSPNDIDFIDQNGVPTVYSEALQGPDGPLSLSDWMRKLKSDDRYGYQFTNQAKQQATNLVMEMEKAFGFRA